MEQIQVPISPGELLDKITILEIKLENVRHELTLLLETWSRAVTSDATVERIRDQLKRINESLWVIEDDIRDKERLREFDDRFIELARSVYFTNDERARLKKELNTHLGSAIVEEKSYQDYA